MNTFNFNNLIKLYNDKDDNENSFLLNKISNILNDKIENNRRGYIYTIVPILYSIFFVGGISSYCYILYKNM